MPTDDPDPNAGASEPGAGSEPDQSGRLKPLTPELRRFMGSGRSRHDRDEPKREAETGGGMAQPPARPVAVPSPVDTAMSSGPSRSTAATGERPRSSSPAPTADSQKLSRKLEMQTVALILGGLILLAAVFYAGTKVHYLRALWAYYHRPKLPNVADDKFPGLSADELVEQGLAAERLGQWKDAVERLLVAKRRNLAYRGILFHAGKLCYENGDFDGADRLFERSTAFGEQVDSANYLRGLVAIGRNNWPAAEQFFEAAVNAEPFTPGYYYNLGETLRREHRPKEAVNRYQQAAARAANEQDATLCRFKTRIATAETADLTQLQNDVEQKRRAGPLSVDWLLTDAALKIRSGQVAEAAQLIQKARQGDESRLFSLFASCISDMLFTQASAQHSEIAEACRTAPRSSASAAVPSASPAAAAATPEPLGSP
jgi:tetratricopeptide (TPR) repeat protein